MHTIRRDLHIALTSQPRESHSDPTISMEPFELLGTEATPGLMGSPALLVVGTL